MRKNYDFSKAKKNPYFKKLKGKKLNATAEISVDFEDLSKLSRKDNNLKNEINRLKRRLDRVEKRLK